MLYSPSTPFILAIWPLLSPDPDVPLALQSALAACFDLVGYENLLDYSVSPPPPALSDAAAAWVDTVLQRAGWRAGHSS